MIVQTEVSFYPLKTEAVGFEVNNFLARLQESDVSIQTGPMSSRLTGELTDVFTALADAFSAVSAHSPSVLILKVSNACPTESE